MENLIEKINKKGQEVRMEEIKKTLSEKEVFEKKLETIKSFGERISKMWDIAQTILDNGFTLGEPINDPCGFPCFSLETESIYHWLGFMVKRHFGQISGQIIGFGIAGGGCDGRHFIVNKNGIADINKNKTYTWGSYTLYRGMYYENPDFVEKVNKIICGFEEYERKFYEYVETLVS